MEVQSDGTMVIVTDPCPNDSKYRVILSHGDPQDKPGTKNKPVRKGDLIGSVQDPAKYVRNDPGKMTPHVHLGLRLRQKGGGREDEKVFNPNEHLEQPLVVPRGNSPSRNVPNRK